MRFSAGFALLVGLTLGVIADDRLLARHRALGITAIQVTQCLKADKG
jgi:hypothetical protein